MKSIDGIFEGFPEIPKIVKKSEISSPSTPSNSSGGFADALTKAIGEVESLQKVADQNVNGLVTGSGDVTTHDAMIALEKADLAFNLMTQIRSKIVRAYEEVMRTQV
jgi:flagellar hook-basal body complex protein FliE